MSIVSTATLSPPPPFHSSISNPQSLPVAVAVIPSPTTTRRQLLLHLPISSVPLLPLLPSSAAPLPVPPPTFFDIPGSGGVKALDLREGSGDTPIDGDQVISGIESAVKSMKVGGIRRVIIPPSQGYQNMSQEPIPPNFFDRQRLFTTIFNPTRLANGEGSTLGTLIFDIELVSSRHTS